MCGEMAAATPRPAARKAQFRLLGFPVHVRYGFVVFMILLAVVPRGDNGEFGIWLAGSVAAFTLLHELGHALVARRAGADAAISLEFMAGYTSYGSQRPISRAWTIAISLAGPLTHIACGCLTLVLMGANPLDHASIVETVPRQAVWWAGPIIGLFNLVPILPLDGGHVVETILDRFIPGRAGRTMVYVSVAITLAALASTPFFAPTRQLSIFIGFLLIIQLTALFDDRTRQAPGRRSTPPRQPRAPAISTRVCACCSGRCAGRVPDRSCRPSSPTHRTTRCAGWSPRCRGRCRSASRGTSTSSRPC